LTTGWKTHCDNAKLEEEEEEKTIPEPMLQKGRENKIRSPPLLCCLLELKHKKLEHLLR
jgi:hypothetical protein